MRHSILKNFFSVVLLHIIFISSIIAQNYFKFDHITIDDGLSQSTVNCIFQDSKGFLWFGSEDGLNRYDGYEIVVYKNDDKNPNSIGHNNVRAMYEDADGVIWIGTWGGGLNSFSYKTGNFSRYKRKVEDGYSIADDYIFDVTGDSYGNIWAGTEGGMLFLNGSKNQYQKVKAEQGEETKDQVTSILIDNNESLLFAVYEEGIFRMQYNEAINNNFKIKPIEEDRLMVKEVWSIYKDKKNNYWIGTSNKGLLKYNASSKQFKQYVHNPNDPHSITNNYVREIIEDKSGMIWAGTDGGGLCMLNPKTDNFSSFVANINTDNSISGNGIEALLEDHNGILWSSAYGAGVNKLNLSNKKFYTYQSIPGEKNSLNNNNINSIYVDKNDAVWLATEGGVNKLDRKTEQFTHFTKDANNPFSINDNACVGINGNNKSDIFIGTFLGGLNIIDPETGKASHYIMQDDLSNGLESNFIRVIFQDSKNTIWIGTNDGGLHSFNPETKYFKRFAFDFPKHDNFEFLVIIYIYEDNEGLLWFGSWNSGLVCYNRETNEFKHYYKSDKPKSLSSNYVTAISQDSEENIWIGTDNGLNLLDKNTQTFTCYKTEQGLINNFICGILEDSNKNLWISSKRGLSKFNIKTKFVKNYTVDDGLQSNEFTVASYFKTPEGEMYFGGVKGFNCFYPEQIIKDTIIPSVEITDFKILNKSVKIGQKYNDRIVLSKSISETRNITLTYEENVFSFEFAALHYVAPKKNQYAYKLENFNKDWVYTDAARRYVTYTNLDPGQYTFRVKASNNDEIWNEKGISLKITILPPFWKTLWFRGLVLFVLIGGAISFYLIRMNTIKKQKKILEHRVKIRTQELSEANYKLREHEAELMQQNEEINTQKEIVEKSNELINSSISYAKSIQQSILPLPETIKTSFNNFIIYRAKDVVSGDFYWFHSLHNTNDTEEKFVAAVIDCTGHGVPGAMMSVIGNNQLNGIIKSRQIYDPKIILEEMHQGVRKTLRQDQTDNDDGMDICLCYIERDKTNNVKVCFAGAKRPLLYYSKKQNKLIRLKGSIRTIGGRTDDKFEFANNKIILEKGDIIYLTSDGYTDQPNEERKKIGTKRFQKWIEDHAFLPIEQQGLILTEMLEQHQAYTQQRDDITVLGFEL